MLLEHRSVIFLLVVHRRRGEGGSESGFGACGEDALVGAEGSQLGEGDARRGDRAAALDLDSPWLLCPHRQCHSSCSPQRS